MAISDFEKEWSNEDVRRYQESSVYCEHCGDIEVYFYYDDDCHWCPSCAYANGYISERQLEIDNDGFRK